MSNKTKRNSLIYYLILWLPVLLQMLLIFYISSRPAGSIVLEEFPFSAPVGHILGYLILGALLYRAFNGDWFHWQFRAAFLTISTGMLYAISDEIHQIFVPGRQATLIDLFYDIIGLLLALLIVRLISWRSG